MIKIHEQQPWWLRTKSGYMITATTWVAVPFIAVFAIKMHERGVLSAPKLLYLICVAIGIGLLFAKSTWDVWLKKKLQE